MSSKWRLLLSVVAIGLALYLVLEKPIQRGLDLEGGTQVVLDLQPRPGQTLTSDTAERTLEVLRRRVDSLGVAEPNLEVAGNKRIIVELPGVTDPTQAVNVIGSTAQLSFHSVEQALGTLQPSTTSAPEAPPTTTTPAATPTTSAGLGASGGEKTVLGQAADTTATSTTATSTSTTATSVPGTTSTTVAAATDTGAQQNPDGSGAVADDTGTVYKLGPSALTGDGVDTATAQPPDSQHTSWYLDLKFKGDGEKAWTKLTGEAACNASGDVKRQVAIVLDNRIISHPQVNEGIQCGVGITGGGTEITGTFTQKETKNLALLVRGGALPVDVKVASQQVIGPELGKAAIKSSRDAVVIGGILTILYILFYYRLLGVLAAIALAVYALLSFGTLLGLNLTLTLPGIAGFILAIAMAMDSNVLVYERVKEELANGRSMRLSGQIGFKNALSAIIDSNATTFIAAVTLFFFAVGEVKGFGVTLMVGTAVSIFVTLVVLRTLVTGLLSFNWARNRPRLLGMSVGSKFRKRMNERPPDLMRAGKYFIAVAVLVTALALSGIGFKGINYGVEFIGGRLLDYQTTSVVNLDKAREGMAKLGFPHATVQRSGTDGTSIRVNELTKEQATAVDQLMTELGGGKADRLRDETVGPSFGKELKKKAVTGLIIGVSLQLLYVAWRFRWTFGLGAVVAMIHDALLVLGLFAWLQKPFDAVFLAALLTIIAFSVNDSVVVFDRIREQRRRRSSEPFTKVVSDACAQTFPRTLNIALSAIFILTALWLLGGQTLSDFALALSIGVVTGVYSSVFIASPIAVYLEGWRPSMSRRSSVKVGGTQSRAKSHADVVDANIKGGEGASSETSSKTVSTKPAPRPRKKKRR